MDILILMIIIFVYNNMRAVCVWLQAKKKLHIFCEIIPWQKMCAVLVVGSSIPTWHCALAYLSEASSAEGMRNMFLVNGRPYSLTEHFIISWASKSVDPQMLCSPETSMDEFRGSKFCEMFG